MQNSFRLSYCVWLFTSTCFGAAWTYHYNDSLPVLNSQGKTLCSLLRFTHTVMIPSIYSQTIKVVFLPVVGMPPHPKCHTVLYTTHELLYKLLYLHSQQIIMQYSTPWHTTLDTSKLLTFAPKYNNEV